MREYGLIGVAGASGAFLRYALSIFIQSGWTGSFPLGTLLINYGGSLILGLLLTWPAVSSVDEKNHRDWADRLLYNLFCL